MKFLFLFLTLLLNLNTEDKTYPKYIWPILGDKLITGSFGEFRYYHFHMGQDLATEGKNGLKVVAIANAKVYKIQNFRYSIGNAIILEHEDGYFSRYGHLTDFSEEVWKKITDKTVLEKRKKRQDFEYILTKEEQLEVKAGDLIAYSGETGIGPSHLHLEIFRDNIYYNPANFGLDHFEFGGINILSVDIVPENHKSFINGKNKPLTLRFKKDQDNIWTPIPNQNIKISGEVSFSVSGNESSGRSNKIGFQKLILMLNGKEIQEMNFDRISYYHTYKANFVLDPYKSRMNGRPFKYFTHSKEGNTLLGTKYLHSNAGVISSVDLTEKENFVKILVVGISKTPNLVTIPLQADSNTYPIGEEKKFTVSPDSFITLNSEDKLVEAYFPAYSVYTKENFKIEPSGISDIQIKDVELLSKIYAITPEYREYNLGYDLYFKSDKDLNSEKIGLYQIYSNRSVKYLYPFTNQKEKFYRIRLKNSGNFAILSDHSKPNIKIYRHKSGHIFPNGNFKLYLITSDTGSGVQESSLSIKIDDLEAYNDLNPETGLREIFYPDSMKNPGKHRLTATVKDKAGNESGLFEFNYTVK
jgi:hypothetical protein